MEFDADDFKMMNDADKDKLVDEMLKPYRNDTDYKILNQQQMQYRRKREVLFIDEINC